MINSQLIIKGSTRASFFIRIILLLIVMSSATAYSNNTQLTTVKKNISDSPTWLALLHTNNNITYITDKSFLLTKQHFSPEAELDATLKYLYSEPQAVCRFPARYLWLKHQLNIPTIDLRQCLELIEFEQKAPADTISLIFASENISQPSSMMGHVLIKISGTNNTGEEKSHAISFYTTIEGFNLPKIIYQNMISGKKGYFSLSPYAEKLTRYNTQENRNVWEYELDIDELHKKILQYHFYELKQTKLTYFFKDYNCATLTQFMLSIIGNQPFSASFFGTTPIDTVKQARNQKLYNSVKLTPSEKWKLRMLNEKLTKDTRKKIDSSLTAKTTQNIKNIENSEQRFLAYETMESSLQLRPINTENDFFLEQVSHEKNEGNQFNINLSNYKDPTKTPNDSQISFGGASFLDENLILLNILPTSHTLEDDNRQYFGETSLTLGETSIAVSPDTGKSFVEKFTLYGVKSLIPHDHFSGGLSGSFRIGAQQQLNSEWKNHIKTYIDGSVGKTFGLGNDISVYGLLGAGISSTREDFFTELKPEAGIIIKEVFNLKSIIEYQYSFTNSDDIPDYKTISFTQTLFNNNKWGLFTKAENITIANRSEEKFSLWLKHYF